MLPKYRRQKQIANADCQQLHMTTDHITLACPIIAEQQYIKRQDRVHAQHFKLYKEIAVKLAMYTGVSV